MKQYIDKDALVAEIEKLKAYLQIPNAQLDAIKVCDNVINVIDTLEVKEVDLEKKNIIGTLKRAVKIDAGGYPYIECDIELYDYNKDIPLAKEGDKVKIVVTKGK